MPPKSYNKKFKKSKHKESKGSSIDDIKRRNAAESSSSEEEDGDNTNGTSKPPNNNKNRVKPVKEEDDEDDGDSNNEDVEGSRGGESKISSKIQQSKPKKKKGADSDDDGDDGFERQGLNRGLADDEHMLAAGPTRKQREEIERERKKKAYEKLHKEGKTDEAKADLERLAKIRKEREEAKAKREAEKAAADAKVASTKPNTSAYVEALGGEKKVPGTKSKDNKKERSKDECGDLFEAYKTEKQAETIDPVNVVAGTIEACRLEEDDFM